MQGMPMTNAPRVLLVEDDPAIARTVCYALERDGIAVRHCLQLADARAQWQAQPPDALLLDVGLPDGNGLDWCRELRQAGAAVPLLVLSARGEEMDRVLGLELGADDYLTKPFSPRELVARTRALLRRAQRLQPAPTASTAPPADALFSIDTQGQRVRMQGVPLELTRREYQLLRCLLERPGRILSREFLLDSIWGQDSDSTDRTVDTHVKTLRAKLRAQVPQQDFIITHRGMGYSLTLPD
ncbi:MULTISPECIES: two-component system response regulator CreB [Delftia]|uniref:Two-component system response regulator CreB n=1 Tax=Delftia lacustris TaxID=558537 RepID=A0A7T2YS16_9BURK|nr:two-component system, OmpR family, catabolic regulation response regulator CreB [Delftia acidovorans CCUG 15835]MXN27457.1 two-component system response regulator CreB [Delftia sp. CH05]QPS80892.1 two-component system response regulator CreB [Delftia lacustris]